MRKLLLLALLAMAFVFESNAQSLQYKVITSVESIVPMGIGRSRIIEEKSPIDAKDFTTERTDGKKSKQSDVKRKDAKVSLFAETKLLNFYSIAGINFQNIASNDALISSKINALVTEGWELAFVTSAVESDSGKGDGKGIFITRYIFKKVN
ncbi:hypothetical protein DWB61_05645 [Ancylomarina euxinus]|uniref:DUF4177 domain-containing protein n=1 Tax=Ancylomarina euxinus TaxID=2283627 RepID=A0A425Y3S9_9BACT|nr:hypothetical protein [Ancylomarina euxinus]MCZ4694519.1 hypothetical protein [Ancylomarina euxinus]MUP14062.1 hypothetical protein [Ancylomarina euxinus]RRG22923.1 hypothetical protein DWB61_05645 [Ancylomarina euxinus]